jgi:hypothetical protein
MSIRNFFENISYFFTIVFVLINKKQKKQPFQVVLDVPGNVLLSQGRVSQLPSALRSLTSVFGMGTGVTFSPLLPDYLIEVSFPQN